MQRKALLLFAVGCVVALAGCSGAFTGGDPGTGDSTLNEVSFPEGVTENGTNVSALADAHSAALENRSFTLAIDSTVNTSAMNQTSRMDAAVGPDRDHVRANVSATGQKVETYLTPERRYVRTESGGNATYRTTNRTADATRLVSSYSGAKYLERFGAIANFTPTGVRTVDGTTLVVLRADGSNATASEQVNVTDYNATLLVDERGVVHSVTVDATTVRNDQQFRVRFSMQISNVGATTVTEPSWLDEARNRTSD